MLDCNLQDASKEAVEEWAKGMKAMKNLGKNVGVGFMSEVRLCLSSPVVIAGVFVLGALTAYKIAVGLRKEFGSRPPVQHMVMHHDAARRRPCACCSRAARGG